MGKQKEIILNPSIEKNEGDLDQAKMLRIAEKLESLKKEFTSDNNKKDSAESYFREALKNLYDTENISLKTEYKTVNENFCGVRLEFLAKYGGMPYLKDFINMFEIKRVSLERKGRQEIIHSLQHREQELRREQMKEAQQNMFGYQQ